MTIMKRGIQWYLKPKLNETGKPVLGMDNELKALLVLLVIVVAICKVIQWHG